jgi:hypothetical protein
MASREKVGVVVGMLCEAFGRKATVPMIEAYYLALSDLRDEQVDAAGLAALRSPDTAFMPTPGQLRAAAATDGVGMDARCEEAWLTLNRAIDKHGAGRSVNFRDGLINATVRLLGGWERCCRLPREEFDKWFRKDFIATYARLMIHGCPVDSVGYLAGECERMNGPWIGQEYGKGGKPYELPAPEDIESPYEPALLSAPGAQQLTRRPAEVPTIEFKRA